MKIDFSYGRKILIKTKTRDKKKFTQKHSLGGGGNFAGGQFLRGQSSWADISRAYFSWGYFS